MTEQQRKEYWIHLGEYFLHQLKPYNSLTDIVNK